MVFPCETWLNVLITVNCFNSSESIAVSVATNVTAYNVCELSGMILLMWYMLHKPVPVAKESIPICIDTAALG